MSWIDAINNFGEANAGAFNIASGAGGVTSVVGFFATLDFQRDVERSLDEIKAQLSKIERNTELIIKQNHEILHRIDQLPTRQEVDIMLREAVADGFIKRAYSSLRAAENDISNFWSNDSPQWVNFRDSLQYLFDHDNRVSKTAELLAHCSFAILLTNGAAVSFVRRTVTKRKDRLALLRDSLRGTVRPMLEMLRDELLGNTEYVESHTLSDKTGDLSTVAFIMHPNRYKWINGPCLVPFRGGLGGCAEPGDGVMVLDREFRFERDRHKEKLDQYLRDTDQVNDEYGEIANLVLTLELILKEME